MDDAGSIRATGMDAAEKLRSSLSRFPRGLTLSQEDLAAIGWLFFFEQETAAQGISDSRLKWLITEALARLDLDAQSVQLPQLIQRLMRFGILRMTIADGARRGYRLTCFGQNLARHCVETVDYSAEQLNVLLTCAFDEIRKAGGTDPEGLYRSLKHVFLGTIREKIEYKLLAIEDDLEERKRTVKRTFSGSSQEELESAIDDIEYCRRALSELVDAVRESSACVSLEELLHNHMEARPPGALTEALEHSLEFLYLLRSRVDIMLKDVVDFIRDCVAYRSLALTVDSRDRLCRIQERLLTHALEHDVRMPVLGTLRLPRMDLNWNRLERERPLLIDREKLDSLDSFFPTHIPAVEPVWKDEFIRLARDRWSDHARRGGVDLGAWLVQLVQGLPSTDDRLWMALWLLSQDWPNWMPPVSIVHESGSWVSLGDRWMMEAIRLVPSSHVQSPAGPGAA